jgi:hypothetical protein
MTFQLNRLFLAAVTALGIGGIHGTAGAQTVPDWPGLYDPFTLLSFHIEVAPEDWTTIVADTTFDIEVPALFWAEDEAPILVSVRRKSGDLLGEDKVSLKIDINEYHAEDALGNDICEIDGGFTDPVCVPKYKGVKKFSLENGDDVNVISEGLAWYLHRRAANSALDYTTGLASWVTVTVNGDSKGVYVNVEQRDKQSLKNHGLWAGGDDTWLYKYSSPAGPDVKESPADEDSPAFNELCYSPFKLKKACRAPKKGFKERLQALINMEGLLTFGAVSAFHTSPDDLFTKAKNYFLVDYSSSDVGKREYFQWDLDSAFHKPVSIYDQSRRKTDNFEKELVSSPDSPFRVEYEAIMRELLDGPFREADLMSILQEIEQVIGAAVNADPNNQLGGPGAAGEFEKLRSFLSKRITSIRKELP